MYKEVKKKKKATREQTHFVPFNVRFGGLQNLGQAVEASKWHYMASFVFSREHGD